MGRSTRCWSRNRLPYGHVRINLQYKKFSTICRICGESIAYVPYSSDLTFMVKGDFVSIGQLVAENWYSQIDNYDFDNHAKIDPNGKSVFNFTQIVWKNSEYLGVGMAKTTDGTQVVGRDFPNFVQISLLLVVCRYFQKGNIEGRRPDFVQPLKGNN